MEDTSFEAEPSAPRKSILHDYIWSILSSAGDSGMISDEVRAEMLIRFGVRSYSSTTARFKEMYDRGLIDYVGRRKGLSRRSQRVMVALPRRADGFSLKEIDRAIAQIRYKV